MAPNRSTHHAGRLVALRLGGAGLLIATGAIHLDLYLTGYRSIPTIGWMFALQVLSAFGLAIAIACTTSWIVAAAGAGFAASTLAGYLLSVWVGLFGFREVRTTAGLVAGVIEVAAVIALTQYVVATLHDARSPARRSGHEVVERRLAVGAVAAASVLAVALFGVSAAVAAGPPSSATGGSTQLAARDVAGVRILTSAQGRTLYWFSLDTPTASNCTGSCTAYWPPITQSASLAPGITGTLGAVDRSGGVRQATYDGHPLYTYIGDSGPGQTSGNGLNLNGGLWHEVVVST
jgi:predicted lipoprotein with Yx(FWY)xxD motif